MVRGRGCVGVCLTGGAVCVFCCGFAFGDGFGEACYGWACEDVSELQPDAECFLYAADELCGFEGLASECEEVVSCADADGLLGAGVWEEDAFPEVCELLFCWCGWCYVWCVFGADAVCWCA